MNFLCDGVPTCTRRAVVYIHIMMAGPGQKAFSSTHIRDVPLWNCVKSHPAGTLYLWMYNYMAATLPKAPKSHQFPWTLPTLFKKNVRAGKKKHERAGNQLYQITNAVIQTFYIFLKLYRLFLLPAPIWKP